LECVTNDEVTVVNIKKITPEKRRMKNDGTAIVRREKRN
jgi:hypothetical protein